MAVASWGTATESEHGRVWIAWERQRWSRSLSR